MIHKQKTDGPRWFVPYELRKDPNAYNYFFKFQNRRRSANDPERAGHQEEEDVECVICMNKISIEVDVDGIIVTKGSSEESSNL